MLITLERHTGKIVVKIYEQDDAPFFPLFRLGGSY